MQKCNNGIAVDFVKAVKGYWRKRSMLLSRKEVLFCLIFVWAALCSHWFDHFTRRRSDNSKIIPFMEC